MLLSTHIFLNNYAVLNRIKKKCTITTYSINLFTMDLNFENRMKRLRRPKPENDCTNNRKGEKKRWFLLTLSQKFSHHLTEMRSKESGISHDMLDKEYVMWGPLSSSASCKGPKDRKKKVCLQGTVTTIIKSFLNHFRWLSG